VAQQANERWLEGDGEPGLVSVVTPVRDRAGLLVEAGASLLAQSYRPLEWVVVDDASAEDAEAALRASLGATRDGFALRWLRQERRGAAAARNRGLAAARGERVRFLDSDDLLERDLLAERSAALAREPGAQVAYGPWRALYSPPRGGLGPLQQRRPAPSEEAMLRGYLADSWYCPCNSYLFTRRAVAGVGSWDEELLRRQDADYLIRTLLSGAGFVHSAGGLALYRQHRAARIGQEELFRAHLEPQLLLARKCRRLLADQGRAGDFAAELARRVMRLEEDARLRGYREGVARCRAVAVELAQEVPGWSASPGWRRAPARLGKRLLGRPLRRLVGERAVAWARAALRDPLGTLADLGTSAPPQAR
jgi:hypothetical protein